MLNPSLSFWIRCTDDTSFPIVGSSGALCLLGLYWAHCTGECNLPHVGWTGECKLPMSWSFRPDFFEVLYLFIPCTYKPDNDHLNTYISPSVACVINRQNIILKYGMRGHFRYSCTDKNVQDSFWNKIYLLVISMPLFWSRKLGEICASISLVWIWW